MIQFLPLPTLLERWPEVRRQLEPALQRDGKDGWALLDGLMAGRYEAWLLQGLADGVVVTLTGYPQGSADKTLWLVYVAGKINGSKAATIRQIAGAFAAMAWTGRCAQLRFETKRGWHRFFDDYEHVPGDPGWTISTRRLTRGVQNI